MNDDSIQQSVLFPGFFGKRLVAQFDHPHGSSDGSALLLKACDERLRLTERLSQCLANDREPSKIRHTLDDLIRQRVFAIACGYADCNDAVRLAEDPIHKLKHKIERFRPVRVSVHVPQGFFTLCNDKIIPSEYLLEDFMNNAG